MSLDKARDEAARVLGLLDEAAAHQRLLISELDAHECEAPPDPPPSDGPLATIAADRWLSAGEIAARDLEVDLGEAVTLYIAAGKATVIGPDDDLWMQLPCSTDVHYVCWRCDGGRAYLSVDMQSVSRPYSRAAMSLGARVRQDWPVDDRHQPAPIIEVEHDQFRVGYSRRNSSGWAPAKFNGPMTQAQIWDRCINGDELAAIINAGPPAGEPPARGEKPLPPDPVEPPTPVPPPIGSDVVLAIGTTPRQTVMAYAGGCNDSTGGVNSPAARSWPIWRDHALPWVTGVRALTLYDPVRAQVQLPYWHKAKQLAEARGVKPWCICTGFVFRSEPDVPMTVLADGLERAVAMGWPEDMIFLFQNEPRGNPGNNLIGSPDNRTPQVHGGNASVLRSMMIDLRRMLADRDLLGIKIGLAEWRHPLLEWKAEAQHFEALVPGMVSACGSHAYNAGPDHAMGSWWMERGGLLVEGELGHNSSPQGQARLVANLNQGVCFNAIHWFARDPGAAHRPGENPDAQGFVDVHGEPYPWTLAWEVVADTLPPGTVMRHVTSSDRPPGMPPDQAKHMWIRDPRQPRIVAAAGKRPDGRMAAVVVNTTHGADSPSPYVGGHYGAATLTVALPLGDCDMTIVRMDGSTSAIRATTNDGWVRHRLAPGDTVGMVAQ